MSNKTIVQFSREDVGSIYDAHRFGGKRWALLPRDEQDTIVSVVNGACLAAHRHADNQTERTEQEPQGAPREGRGVWNEKTHTWACGCHESHTCWKHDR